jgi:hypothetical protein
MRLAMNKIIEFIGSVLVWAGYVLLSRPPQGIPKKFVQGILVQPVLLGSLSNLKCFGDLSQKGGVFLEHPFPGLLDSRSEHQLARDLGTTVVQWRRRPPEEAPILLEDLLSAREKEALSR